MRVIVTGGAGFIGKYVEAELLNQGHTSVIFDRPSDVSAHPDSPHSIFALDDADAVIHMAGMLGTAELFSQFDLAVDVNVKGTQRVLEYCKQRDARYVGITMPDVWANVYQATKRCATVLATAYHESFGVPVSHVRAFNAYGAGQKYGHGHPQKIIPTFAYRAWRDKDIDIWGDGTQTVDLISAGELAKLLVGALDYGDDEIFDGGTGQEWTVNQVAQYVLAHTSSYSKICHRPMREGERPHTRLSALGEGWPLLGWEPTLDMVALDEAITSYK